MITLIGNYTAVTNRSLQYSQHHSLSVVDVNVTQEMKIGHYQRNEHRFREYFAVFDKQHTSSVLLYFLFRFLPLYLMHSHYHYIFHYTCLECT